jgi:glutamine cyclotransferase
MMRLAILALMLPVAGSAPEPIPVSGVRIVHAYPHDRNAFTEGLFYRGGRLFESTGLEGRSDIREVRLEDGKVLRRVALPPNLFGEGIVDWGKEIVSLTWQGGQGFRWDLASFRQTGQFRYSGEGWALTRNASEIVMSDGTPTLRFLDPKTLKVRRTLKVTEDGQPVRNLNELEWVKGEIFANIWLTDQIVRIDPKSGRVVGQIDLAPLVQANRSDEDSVANGIAYDSARDRLFVTGKNWAKLYEVKLVPPRR